MDGLFLEPWLPHPAPDLARLAFAAADEEGGASPRVWPEFRKGGVGFQDLPPFLPWVGREKDASHLVLLQARELGALVPGARVPPLPSAWLESLDLRALAVPLGRAFPEGARVHVAQVKGPGRARTRDLGTPWPQGVARVLERLTGTAGWRVDAC
jgi:hypothetical protein